MLSKLFGFVVSSFDWSTCNIPEVILMSDIIFSRTLRIMWGTLRITSIRRYPQGGCIDVILSLLRQMITAAAGFVPALFK
jgi:hypothetical protein